MIEEEERLHYKYKHVEILHWAGLFSFNEIKENIFNKRVLRQVSEEEKKRQEDEVPESDLYF